MDLKEDCNKIIRVYDKSNNYKLFSVDEMIANKYNQWKGWKCAAGLEHLYIGYDGDVYRGNCRVGGLLGNVYKEFTSVNQWITCSAEFCGCGSDVMTPKVKNLSSQKKLMYGKTNTRNFFRKKPKQVGQIAEHQAVETNFRTHSMRIQWDIGRRCNFNCSYCWPDVHSSTEALKSYETLKTAAEYVLSKVHAPKGVLFQFGGGEPTIYPNFLEFIQLLKSKGHDCVVTTNGSRQPSYLRKLIRYCNLNISVHFEFANLERLEKSLAAMIAERTQNPHAGVIELKIMTPPESVQKAKIFYMNISQIKDFHEHIRWSFVPLRHGLIDKKLAAKMIDYTEEDLQFFKTGKVETPGELHGHA